MQTFASIMCAKFCVMLSLFFISLCFLYIVDEEVLYMGTKKNKKGSLSHLLCLLSLNNNLYITLIKN